MEIRTGVPSDGSRSRRFTRRVGVRRLQVLRANTRAIAFYERHGALRTDERVCLFEQGFELPTIVSCRTVWFGPGTRRSASVSPRMTEGFHGGTVLQSGRYRPGLW